MSKESNIPLERRMKVLEAIIKHIKQKPDEYTFTFEENDFYASHKLLGDKVGLKFAFEKIYEETRGNVSIEFDFVATDPITTATGEHGIGGHGVVKVHVENPDELLAFFKKYSKEKKNKKVEEKVEKLELLPDEFGESFTVYINENYDLNVVKPNHRAKVWKAFKEIAENKTTARSKRDAEDVVEYFNTRPENMLYSRTHYTPTDILINDDGDIRALIPVDIISKRKISRSSPKTPKNP